MNRAQRNAWLRLLISVATLLIASILIIYVRSCGIDISDFSTPARIRRYVLLGLLQAVPIILIVVIDWGWKKVYDERDLQIEAQAAICGWVGALTFIALAGCYLIVATKNGSIKAGLILLLVYLAFFVSIVVVSIVALILYGRRQRNE